MRCVLSRIEFVHGDRRPVADLAEASHPAAVALGDDIVAYRETDQEIWDIAVQAAQRTLDGGAPPDLLLYVSENEHDRAAALVRIVDRLGLPDVDYLAVSGYDCGNFGAALRIARDVLHAGSANRVLIVLADRARHGNRVMMSGLSVFSDGAAACIVTRDIEPSAGPAFRVVGIVSRSRVDLEAAGSHDTGILATARLGAAVTADVFAGTGLSKDDFTHVAFANYRIASQRFLTAAIGFPQDRLLVGDVAEYAHCFSADIPINLSTARSTGTLESGDRVLASTIGPFSWSAVAAECV